MKIAIFGGGGFIGSNIADRLLLDKHELRIFERPRVEPYRKFSESEKVQWITGDMMSVRDVVTAIDGVDVILHLVSTTLPKNSNDDPVFDVQSNLVVTLQLLDAMVLKGIKKIVFISSGGTVYGRPQYLPIDESHPTEPRVSYGITKLAIEKYMLMYQELHGIKVNILRVANPYGQRQRVETAQGAVGIFLNRAILRQPIEIWGDGSVTRDYIYISDVAEAFASAVVYEGKHSVFNVSSGVGTSLNELIALLEDVLGFRIERQFLPGRNFDVPASTLSNALAHKELAWEPRTSLNAGLSITAEWVRRSLV
jgi:UDP-glucose 4-epimerase